MDIILPLCQILSITFSWYNTAETQAVVSQVIDVSGVKYLSLPQSEIVENIDK